MNHNPIKLLIFEDNPGDVDLFKHLLAEDNDAIIEYEHVARFQDGIERVNQGGIDLILLDLDLPDSHGFETFDNLQKQVPELPIIVLTGNKDDQLAVKAVQSGAQDYLIKDNLDSNLLVRAIHYAMERHRLLDQLEKARHLERRLAYHDSLTNLPNRLLFHDRLKQAMAQGKRFDQKVALLFLDLDGFKRINDTLGHTIGDHLLQAVAERLKRCIREVDTIARLGGDEFTIVLVGINHQNDAVKVARKILNLMANSFLIEGHELFVTVSIGISIYPTDAHEMECLIKNADIAMYRAKGHGKNNYQLYNLSMDAEFFEFLALENSLRKALENEELVAHYQPQVNLTTGEITGVEALMRWQHPEFGLVSPAKFIPLAEETGIIVPFDVWMLTTACQQLKRWQDLGFENLTASVNLSTRQFRRKDLPNILENILDKTGISPQHLCLEITESNVMQNVENTVELLHELKKMGLQLSVDDFGTGYSSLNYLKKFPIDTLKIDRSFVKGIPTDRNDTAISTAIVVLGHSMDLQVVAEGVETAEQLSFLQSLDCDQMQGFYFSRPLPAKLLTDLLKSGKKLLSNGKLKPV